MRSNHELHGTPHTSSRRQQVCYTLIGTGSRSVQAAPVSSISLRVACKDNEFTETADPQDSG